MWLMVLGHSTRRFVNGIILKKKSHGTFINKSKDVLRLILHTCTYLKKLDHITKKYAKYSSWKVRE